MTASTTGVIVIQPAVSDTPAEAANPELNELDALQMLLDLSGMIPGAGAVPDLLNTAISLARGDFLGAALSAFSAVPLVGDAIGAAKILKNYPKYAAALSIVETKVLPKLPQSIAKPLKEFIDKAKAKLDDLMGRNKKPPPEPEKPIKKNESKDVIVKKRELVYDDKIKKQMEKRGWTKAEIDELSEGKPSGSSIDKRSSKKTEDGLVRDDTATVYGNKSKYIVINNRTNEVVQISDKANTSWIPDSRITWY